MIFAPGVVHSTPTVGNVEVVRLCLRVSDYMHHLGGLHLTIRHQGEKKASVRKLEIDNVYLNDLRLLEIVAGPSTRWWLHGSDVGANSVLQDSVYCIVDYSCDAALGERAAVVAAKIEETCSHEYWGTE